MMNKEEFKQFEKDILLEMKKISKEEGYKKVGTYFWKIEDSFFYNIDISGNYEQQRMYCILSMKLIDYDTIYWNISDLKSNFKHAKSLHANGAFVFYSFDVFKTSITINNDTSVDLICNEFLREVKEFISKLMTEIDCSPEKFNDKYIKTLPKLARMERIVMTLYKKDLNKARELSMQNDVGPIRTVDGKWVHFSDDVIEYCNHNDSVDKLLIIEDLD